MPCWSRVLQEIQELNSELSKKRQEDPDSPEGRKMAHLEILKKYLCELERKTGRFTIFYASAWLHKHDVPSFVSSVHLIDMEGFLECVYHAEGNKNLDLILHSPGGSPEAAEQIITYLRGKFDSIRVIVPMQAMSAATMMALAADEILLTRHSTLGPTDPQFFIYTNTGVPTVVSAHALREEFEKAKADTKNMAAWAPILSQYPPGIFAKCEHALDLTKELAVQWLANYMLKSKHKRQERGQEIASFFAAPHHHSHGRPLMFEDLRKWRRKGLKVRLIEDDQAEQELVMSAWHAMSHMLGGTPVSKAIMCSRGEGYLRYHNPVPQAT